MHLPLRSAKPILCFFGDSRPNLRPWKTPYELLRPVSRDLKD